MVGDGLDGELFILVMLEIVANEDDTEELFVVLLISVAVLEFSAVVSTLVAVMSPFKKNGNEPFLVLLVNHEIFKL